LSEPEIDVLVILSVMAIATGEFVKIVRLPSKAVDEQRTAVGTRELHEMRPGRSGPASIST
jgi:hypothetical protein